MNLTQLLESLRIRLTDCIDQKYTGQIRLEVNMKEGGIGTVAIRENKIEWLKK